MSQMKFVHAMEQLMEQSLEEAVRATFREGRSSGDAADDVEAFIHSLLVRLGLRTDGQALMMKSVSKMRAVLAVSPDASDDELLAVTAEAPAVTPEAGSDSESAGKDRKRTVSKKMKDTFLAMEGGTEESLKAAMKTYKSADQAQIDGWGGKWDSFARAFLAGECTPAKKKAPAKSSAPKAKKTADPDAPAKEKAPKVAKNFTWTPTAKKLFAEVVEGNGGKVTDELKSEFVAHVNAMDVEKYKEIAPVGHVRAFIASKAEVAAVAPAVEDDEDEDLEEIEVEGEKLSIGVKSGKIFRATEDSGDVQIGVAGQGKFKDVKIPSA
jgi:hypothetical protein